MKWMAWSLLFVLLPVAAFADSQGLPLVSPQDISRERAKLYLEGAREPLAKIAPQIYQFAADSERCRLNSGTEACGLTDIPLKDGSLKGVFNYYVKEPVEAVLNRERVRVHKRDWTWEPSAHPR